MNASSLAASLPLLIICGAALLLMVIVAVRRNHKVVFSVSLAALALAFVSLWFVSQGGERTVTNLLVMDDFALVFMGVLLASSAGILLIAYSYLNPLQEHKEEFYMLVLLGTAGGMVLVASNHFASLFLGLEILSVALYALVAYLRRSAGPLEAGIKYLVLASSSVAFLLFGIALVYEETGSLEFSRVSAVLNQPGPDVQLGILWTGVALLITGIGFKLALVPFHLWTPDVYQGAPLPVTALIATLSKASVFGLFLRWVHPFLKAGSAIWIVLAICAIASMLAGNLLALFQTNVKRLLAYSSIAHMGYFFVAVLAGGSFGFEAGTYYLIAYLVTITGALGTLTLLCENGEERCEVEDYRGLFWRRPAIAAVLTMMLLSMAGIPLTAGFLGKFYVMTASASAAMWSLVFVLIVSSVIGLFYYLRVVIALYAGSADDLIPEAQGSLSRTGLVSVAAFAILLVCFGVYPAILWKPIADAINSLH